MKPVYIFLCFCIILCACSSRQQATSDAIQVIPEPLKIEVNSGSFRWSANTKIIITENRDDLKNVAGFLSTLICNATGIKHIEIEKGSADSKQAIIFRLLAEQHPTNADESYELTINNQRVLISAASTAGLFYGMQTLIQMMPAESFISNGLKDGFTLGAVNITDAPRFPYRGLHLDVSRSFYTKDQVKKYIDLMSKYKFNRFHWHLTDGGGWRIEIKKYPLLTQKTAFRMEQSYMDFAHNGHKFVSKETSGAYGGYYTQDDIREIIAYAAERYITIIPEIEMPGHSSEVFAAYPELSCSGKPYKDGDFCAGNDKTFEFLEGVLTEVMDLFPSEYIHIGGDEAGKHAWRTCPKCKKRMQTEGLDDLNELQSYFMRRISDFVTKKGRKVLGWDEITEGGLPEGATVMAWRDGNIGEEVARQGHNVVAAPTSICYFDYYQSNPQGEPLAIGGYIPLQKVYEFEVVPNDSLASYFLGGQANLWTEYIPDFKHAEYMVYPRALALSEALWSSRENRDWNRFRMKLFENHFSRLDYLDVNARKPSNQIVLSEKVDTLEKRISICFETEKYKPELRYTIDGSIPTSESELYKEPFYIDHTHTINAAIFENGRLQEPVFTKEISYHSAVGKKVIYHEQWKNYPAGGETALVDGYYGGLGYGDGFWQGFTSNLNVTIDMGEAVTLNSFRAKFLQLITPRVFMPEYVEVSLSTDGDNFKSVLKVKNDISRDKKELLFKDFSGSLGGEKARYIKVFAKNVSQYSYDFIFVDELVIN